MKVLLFILIISLLQNLNLAININNVDESFLINNNQNPDAEAIACWNDGNVGTIGLVNLTNGELTPKLTFKTQIFTKNSKLSTINYKTCQIAVMTVDNDRSYLYRISYLNWTIDESSIKVYNSSEYQFLSIDSDVSLQGDLFAVYYNLSLPKYPFQFNVIKNQPYNDVFLQTVLGVYSTSAYDYDNGFYRVFFTNSSDQILTAIFKQSGSMLTDNLNVDLDNMKGATMSSYPQNMIFSYYTRYCHTTFNIMYPQQFVSIPQLFLYWNNLAQLRNEQFLEDPQMQNTKSTNIQSFASSRLVPNFYFITETSLLSQFPSGQKLDILNIDYNTIQSIPLPTPIISIQTI